LKKFGFGGERSGGVLTIALVIYTFILASVFGSLWGLKPSESLEVPHGIFEYWIHRYQTLIGAAFVIFTVAIAADQVRESRRQHEQSMRLSFMPEISSLNHAESLAKRCVKDSSYISKVIQSWVGKDPLPTKEELNAIIVQVDPTVAAAVRTLGNALAGEKIPQRTKGAFDSLFPTNIDHLLNKKDVDVSYAANCLLRAIEERRVFLRLFVPGV